MQCNGESIANIPFAYKDRLEAESKNVTPIPKSLAPTSNAHLVRVDVFSNKSTICFPLR